MATIDSYSETNQDSSYDLYNGGYTAASQSFTGNGANLDSCKFYLKKTGAPTGNITAILYAHNGTYGTSSSPTGSALATSGTYASADLTTSYQLIEFTFGSPYTVVNGTKYCITANFSGGLFSDYVSVGLDASSPSHGGNAAYYDGSWNPVSTKDLCFYCLSAQVDITVNLGLQAATGAILAPSVTGDANVTAGLQAAVAAILSASMTGDVSVTLGLLQALATMYSVTVSIPGVGHYMSLSELISLKGEIFNPEGKRLRIHIASKSGKKVNL